MEPLDRIRPLYLAHPEVEERLSHGSPAWFWKGKRCLGMFADHHHGVDWVALWVPCPPGIAAALVAGEPPSPSLGRGRGGVEGNHQTGVLAAQSPSSLGRGRGGVEGNHQTGVLAAQRPSSLEQGRGGVKGNHQTGVLATQSPSSLGRGRGGDEDSAPLGGQSPYVIPPYVGPKGWVGIKLGPETDWDAVAGLIEEAIGNANRK